MSRALQSSLQKLRKWVFQSDSRVERIAGGQGIVGTRAAPTQISKNDKSIGSRLDHGETIIKDGKRYKRYKLQVNKGADDRALKQLADKDSHKVWAQAEILLGEDDSSKVLGEIDPTKTLGKADPSKTVNQLFDDLEDDLKK